jgi:hypothetical protein
VLDGSVYHHKGIYSFLILPLGGSHDSYLTRCVRFSALHPGKSGGLVIVVVGNGRIDLGKGPSAARIAADL